MRKQHFTNLVLFAFIVCLALIVWLKPFESEPAKHSPLTTINRASVSKISLLREGTVVFSLEKADSTNNETWKLVQPTKIPANSLKVKQILNVLSTNSLRKYQIKSVHLEKLGLAEPAWQLVFESGSVNNSANGSNQVSGNSANSNQITIGFGKTEPVGQKRYVLFNNTVHLINDRVSQFNFGSPLMLANLDILPVDKSVKEVHLPDRVIRRVDGQWQSSSPTEKTVSQSTYKEFIDEWRYAQASRVALADKNEMDVDAKPVTVVLEKAEQPIHFMVESSGQDYIVTNKDWGVRYYLNSDVGEKLLHITNNTSKEQ